MSKNRTIALHLVEKGKLPARDTNIFAELLVGYSPTIGGKPGPWIRVTGFNGEGATEIRKAITDVLEKLKLPIGDRLDVRLSDEEHVDTVLNAIADDLGKDKNFEIRREDCIFSPEHKEVIVKWVGK